MAVTKFDLQTGRTSSFIHGWWVPGDLLSK